MRETLTIATRGSKLALWQAEHISARIGELNPDIEIELLVIKTKGDKILDAPLAKIGGKGLFVKEIEEALLDGRADLAVHSLKDVPAEQPPGLILGVTPRREELSDRLLSVDYHGLEGLPHGARVGTSSLRRKAQLLMRRPDLDIVDLRGNLDTRVGKLLDGQFAAIVVAAAGLNRLGLGAPKSVALAPPEFLPAAGQGALCLEYRRNDDYLAELLAPLDHPETRDAVAAERGFLGGLDGGCQVPIAAWGRLSDPETIRLTGFVSDAAGERVFRLEAAGPRTQAAALGRELAERLKALGAGDVLAEVYGLERGQDRGR